MMGFPPAMDWLHAPLQAGMAVVIFVAHLLTAARALTRPNRAPASRAAWVAVIMLAPMAGMIAYLLLGETSIGRSRLRRLQRVRQSMTQMEDGGPRRAPAMTPQMQEDNVAALFSMAQAINGFSAAAGNHIVLLGAEHPLADPTMDCRAAIDRLVADIGQASESVHIAFYIWLDDGAGGRVADAVAAAARRGVACRVMVDALGSRGFVKGPRWQQLRQAGVRQLVTLDDINRLQHIAFSRMDLRDHRKIVVIDNRTAFCGSQNCADPEFRVKPAFAPWIDLLLRCEGPVVRQMQYLFLSGWIPESGEVGLDDYAATGGAMVGEGSATAIAFETGPITRHNAMADMFVACIYAARRELVISTPYFVPDESLLRALCAAPRRGVATRVIFPARNDSWLVGQSSRSTYADLLQCGVEVFEYPLGLLHAKSLTLDGAVALVGSANMDRRSLELNFENNLLIADMQAVMAIRQRQQRYLDASAPLALQQVQAWPFHSRLTQNAVAMMSPVL